MKNLEQNILSFLVARYQEIPITKKYFGCICTAVCYVLLEESRVLHQNILSAYLPFTLLGSIKKEILRKTEFY